MRFSQPTNPLSVEIAKLTIRVYDALHRAGVSTRMVCSRNPAGFYATSRSKYLRINGGAQIIRISDHRSPAYRQHKPDLDLIITSVDLVKAAEARAFSWIEQTYGSPQVQATAA